MQKYSSTGVSSSALAEYTADDSDDSDSEVELVDELNRYLANDDKDKDVLAYWSEKSKRFPILSKIVLKIYSIPASTAEVERLFSSLRIVVDDYRYNLSEETTSMIMLGKYCPEV